MAVRNAHCGQLFGILHRNGAKADSVDELKYGSVCPDPQGKCPYRDKRESGAEAKHPQSVTKILPQ